MNFDVVPVVGLTDALLLVRTINPDVVVLDARACPDSTKDTRALRRLRAESGPLIVFTGGIRGEMLPLEIEDDDFDPDAVADAAVEAAG